MGQINIEGISLYAFHGCLEEEAKIGANYEVSIFMEYDFKSASTTDMLSKTIDYVVIYEIVKKQMAIRSKLLEHVGKRIYDAIVYYYKNLDKLKVSVSKLNPPMNGNVSRVTIIVEE